jgi:hypothetical protein
MPRIEEVRSNDIRTAIVRAKSTAGYARTYISRQPGATVVPLLRTHVETIEQLIEIINNLNRPQQE